jgi:GABA(A) receptor-associated protein
MSVEKFQKNHTFEKRAEESSKVIDKYKDRIPIIVLKHENCTLPTIDKHKYLVPKDMSFSQFIFVIRKRIQLNPSETLFTVVNGQLVNGSTQVDEIYHRLKDKDGFLYVVYTSENTFG